MSINKSIITGNLTHDAELRKTPSDVSVLGFSVAVNERRKNQKSGEWEEYANFIPCTLFGKRADVLAKYLSKGTKVAVEGKLHWSSWEADDGTKRSKIEITVEELEFLSSANKAPAEPAEPYSDEDIDF